MLMNEPVKDNPVLDLQSIPMKQAVGYSALDCEHETPVEHSLVLKHDRVFLLLDRHGDIAPAGGCSLGLFQDDTRILSHYALQVAGGPPSLLSSQLLGAYGAQFDLVVNDLAFGGQRWDPKNSVHIRREMLLDDRMVERLTLTNHLVTPIEYWLELGLGCDFADIFEVRGWHREQRGAFFQAEIESQNLIFHYQGRDGRILRSCVRFLEPPDELSSRSARWRFRLEPDTPRQIQWEVVAEDGTAVSPAGPKSFIGRRAEVEGLYARWYEQCSQWSSNSPDLNQTLSRAIGDLRALYIEVNGEDIISAGIPWYSTVFGRDSIITSLETLPVNPVIAVDTLRYLAQCQGTREVAFTEEQPGKIIHELRRGEMARSGEIPHVPYYGTVDATPLWLILLQETWRWTGDRALIEELLPNAERALAWIDRYGDIDGDGFVEYTRISEKGLVNQGWKDSGDGVPYPDGRLPNPPIALVEVQGYVYDAKSRMAALYEALGERARSGALRREAEVLRGQIIDRFWLEQLGTFAIALDGEKQPIPTATSNAGHLLWSRVAPPPYDGRLARQLLGPDMFSGWGIRTLSAAHPVFNPMSYHNGSVWPHDNAIIALGLAINDHDNIALPIVQGMYEAAAASEHHRLPELFCGMAREGARRPVLYPVSCSPQAWASAAMFMMLQGILGILPDAPAGVLHIRNPVLPDFLKDLTITRLPIGGSRVSLHFHRYGERTLVNLYAIEGKPLQVRIELD
jgi:glycogen debranching enzyme